MVNSAARKSKKIARRATRFSTPNSTFMFLQVTYLTHACMELQLGGKKMIFDPWLTGPAFARGWWLLHEPPADSMERLCMADLIYISHMHSDHLRYSEMVPVWNVVQVCRDGTCT